MVSRQSLRIVFALLFAFAPRGSAQDVLSVGGAPCVAGAAGSVVQIPVYVRDASGTPLGVDQPAGSRIQAISFQILPTSTAAIASDATGLLANVTPAGITAALGAPQFVSSPRTPTSFGYIVIYDETTQPIPFGLDAALPGNQVASIGLTLSNTAAPGTTIALTVNPAATVTQLINEAGTLRETVANGGLAIAGGCVTVTAAETIPTLGFIGLVVLALLLCVVVLRARFPLAVIGLLFVAVAARAQDDPAPHVPFPSPGGSVVAPAGVTTIIRTDDGYTIWRNQVSTGCSFGDHNFTIDVTADPEDLSDILVSMTTFDVDFNNPQACAKGPEVDAMYVNGRFVAILRGANNSWSTNSFRLSNAHVKRGANTIRIDTDAPGTGCWCVGVGYVEIRARVGFQVVKFTPQAADRNRDFHASALDLTVTFSADYDPATLNDNTFKLQYRTKAGSFVTVQGRIEQLAPDRFRFRPFNDLKDGIRYHVTLRGGATGVKSNAKAELELTQRWDFWTVPDLTRTDFFSNTCRPATPPCRALQPVTFQTARNEQIVARKLAVTRLYARWIQHVDVFEADQLTELDLQARLTTGTTNQVQTKRFRRFDKQTTAEINAGDQTLNFYHEPNGELNVNITATPTPQTNATPVRFTASQHLAGTGKTPRLRFNYFFIRDGAYANGVPAAVKTAGANLIHEASVFTTDTFPTLSTLAVPRGETSVGYTYTGNTVQAPPPCGMRPEVDCGGVLVSELECAYANAVTLLGGRPFVILTDGNTLCRNAAAVTFGNVIFHDAPAVNNDASIAHEIGHVFGLKHLDLTEGVEGFQPRTRVNRSRIENPARARSLMNRQVQPDGTQWIDVGHYGQLLNRSDFDAPPDVTALNTSGGDYLIVRGIVDTTANRLDLFPSFLQEVPNDVSDPSGTCLVELLNAGNNVVSSERVSAGITINGERVTTGRLPFSASVPFSNQARKLRVTCGALTTTVTASTHAPAVTFTAPADGATLSGTTNVTWTGTDADAGDKLLHQLQLSEDAGTTWQPLTALTAATQHALDTRLLASGTGRRLRVLVTDGFHTTFATRVVNVANGLTVQATLPAGGAAHVLPTEPITVTFVSDASHATLVNGLTLRNALGQNVAGRVSYDVATRTATFTPNAPLAFNTTYTARLAPTVADVQGNTIGTAFQWSFTTVVDTVPPLVVHRSPEHAATGVPTNPLVTVRFDEAVDGITLTKSSFRLLDPAGNAVPATLLYKPAALQLILTPSAPLAADTTYTVRLENSVTDAAGNALEHAEVWSFTTGAGANPVPVRIVGRYGDEGIDTTGDGVFDVLRIRVDVEVRQNGGYNLNGRLIDRFDELIEWQTTGDRTLETGVHTLALTYSGAAIRGNGVDGPYTLDALNFYLVQEPQNADVRFSAYQTFAYASGEFFAALAFGGLPDQLVEKNTIREDAFSLRAMTTHVTRPLTDVTYRILINTDPALGISIDGGANVDIRPAANAEGESEVTIEARDPDGNRAIATFNVIVAAARASVLTPAFDDTMRAGETQTISVAVADQFGRPFTQPATVTFTATAGSFDPASTTTSTGTAATSYTAAGLGPAFLTITTGTVSRLITIDVTATIGDANGDGALTADDATYLVEHLFNGGPAPVSPSDVNGDGTLDVADVVYLMNFLKGGGPAPVGAP